MKRRTFVFSPVALGLFSPFIRALEARANVLERDSYFITMHKAQHLYTNNNPAHFVPKMEGGRMVLPPDLIAFEGLQAFLTFVVGLDLKVNGGGDWHDCARSLFTGSANAGGRFGKPSNESIEAYVAAKIGLTSGPLAINPYHLADASTSDAYQPCWMRQASGAIVKVTPVADPLTLWNRLFAGFQPSGSTPTSPGSGAQNSVEAARFAARQSLFDSVRDDIQVLRDQVASEHRQQLQAHLDGFRELEKRVIGANGKPNPTMQDMNRVCAVPNQPSSASSRLSPAHWSTSFSPECAAIERRAPCRFSLAMVTTSGSFQVDGGPSLPTRHAALPATTSSTRISSRTTADSLFKSTMPSRRSKC
jgi:hypothetical protein